MNERENIFFKLKGESCPNKLSQGFKLLTFYESFKYFRLKKNIKVALNIKSTISATRDNIDQSHVTINAL